MNNKLNQDLSRILYLPHGGGPLPLMGDRAHTDLIRFLKEVGQVLGTPSAILMISAHWEETEVNITSGSQPELFFDYYGFPPETYQIKYPAPGHPELAGKIEKLVANAGFGTKLDAQRGFDHGMFVPLKLIYPEANIPCVQLSLIRGLDPKQHIELGKSLMELRKQKVLIIGSGMSFHNMRALMTPQNSIDEHARDFDEWLANTCTSDKLTILEREKRLVDWEAAPNARYCHPREEHLLPLHVCFGAAIGDGRPAERVFSSDIMGRPVSAILW